MPREKGGAVLEEGASGSEGEAEGFVQAFSKAVTFYVKEAFVVEAEGLGIFTPYINAETVDSLDEATEKTIKKKGLRYRPTKAMEVKLERVKFQKANLDVEHI